MIPSRIKQAQARPRAMYAWYATGPTRRARTGRSRTPRGRPPAIRNRASVRTPANSSVACCPRVAIGPALKSLASMSPTKNAVVTHAGEHATRRAPPSRADRQAEDADDQQRRRHRHRDQERESGEQAPARLCAKRRYRPTFPRAANRRRRATRRAIDEARTARRTPRETRARVPSLAAAGSGRR